MSERQTMKKVMPEMIDDELVLKIIHNLGEDWIWESRREAIRQMLTWLANNPIEPTTQEANNLWQIDLCLNSENNETCHAASNMVLAFQRIAYLKKEEELPEELRDLMNRPFDKASFTECWNERIITAYKLGKGLK